MKKILLDTLCLLSPLTGIGRYTYEISKRLEKLSAHKYEIFFNYGYHSKDFYRAADQHKKKKLQSFIKKIPKLKSVVRKLYIFSTQFYQAQYDLYFQPNFIPNENIKSKKVICTVHDFSFFLYPEWHQQERVNYFNNHLTSIKKADQIITGSDFTKQEIVRFMKIPQDKINVIYHGIDHSLYKSYAQNELEETKVKFNLPDIFLLFVGSIEPRKNLSALLKAYDLLTREQKYQTPLILVGFEGWENAQIMKEIGENREFVRYLGYITDKQLAHIYNLSTIFIYPSLYEGFGLPPLEAMACGTCVIVSNRASMPEICGDAALYIDPTDHQDINDKILRFLNSKTLREDFSKKGKIQSSLFSWDKAAFDHFVLFEQMLRE